MNFRKYILPCLLILGLGLALATAQNITKSVQLSQDGSGTIGYDTSNGVYFPQHILSTIRGGPAPTVATNCGTTGQTVTGTDFNGQITIGSSVATVCALTFGTAYNTAPTCVASPASGVLAAFSYVTAVTGITFTQTSTANNRITYICSSLS